MDLASPLCLLRRIIMQWHVKDGGLSAFSSCVLQSLPAFPLRSPFSLHILVPSSAKLSRWSYTFTAVAGPACKIRDGQVAFPVYLEERMCWVFVWVPREYVPWRVIWSVHLRVLDLCRPSDVDPDGLFLGE